MTTDDIRDALHDIACALSGGPADCDAPKAAYLLGQLNSRLYVERDNHERMADELARVTAERDDYANTALAGLGGIVCTPEKGYLADGGPGQLRADFRELRKEVDRLVNADARLRVDRSNLRAALQRIADDPLTTEDCRRWAADALEGWIPAEKDGATESDTDGSPAVDRPSIEDAARTLGVHARLCWPRVVSVGIGSKDGEPAIYYMYDHEMQGVMPQPEITEWQGWPVVMKATGQMRLL